MCARIVDCGRPPTSDTVSHLEVVVPMVKRNVPDQVIQIVRERKLDKDSSTKDLMTDAINHTNYVEKFRLLLYVESLQKARSIRRYRLQYARLVKDDIGLMGIVVPGLVEKRPSLSVRDCVHVSMETNRSEIFVGFIHEIVENVIKVNFGPLMWQRHTTDQRYRVEFKLNTFSTTLMHRSLDIIDKKPEWLNVLIPNSQEVRLSRRKKIISRKGMFNGKLKTNLEQVKAVKDIVGHKVVGVPYVIFGPPGTGKTVTVVEAILQIYKLEPNSHILVCATSNSACDLLVDRLMESHQIDINDIFRMNARSRRYRTIDSEVVRKVSNYMNARAYFPSKATLMKYRIIVCTLITAGRLASARFPDGHFTNIFMDEAGCNLEPECLVAIAGVVNPNSRIVLAGDCMQLGPIVQNILANNSGLGMSMLERLLLRCEFYAKENSSFGCTTKLLNNYRSHEAILKIPNQQFYGNELRVCASEKERNEYCKWDGLQSIGFPVMFRNVVGVEERDGRNPSCFNLTEVSEVLTQVFNLIKTNAEPKHIGIITPYYKQVIKIRQALANHHRDMPKFADIKVGTVEEFQGQERKVIIISTVRSNPKETFDKNKDLGFLQNPKRFNVAVTRAKALLILVGNSKILRRDIIWNTFLDHCAKTP